MKRPPLALEPLLWPPAKLYEAVVGVRNFAYDRGWFLNLEVGKPVLSIGNVTSGGTGKTPVTAFLIESFSARGLRVGVVSRGYGGSEKGPVRVPHEQPSPRQFGDEPAWLATRYPHVPVFIGADRFLAATKLLSESPVDLILADDAFQHRRLARAFDLVVIDATEPHWHYRPLPLGRSRESFHALRRAHAVFITKTNLASPENNKWLRSKVESHFGKKTVVEMESRLTGSVLASAREKKLLLVSGIGRPETFAQLVKSDAGATILEHMIYADHHAYSAQDLNNIFVRAETVGADEIWVTEKDSAKLKALGSDRLRPDIPLLAAKLEVRPKTGLKEFYEAVDRILFQRR